MLTKIFRGLGGFALGVIVVEVLCDLVTFPVLAPWWLLILGGVAGSVMAISSAPATTPDKVT